MTAPDDLSPLPPTTGDAAPRDDNAPASLASMWASLKNFTDARIGLPRAGASVDTHTLLALRLAHAKARDAVHVPFDVEALTTALQPLGMPVLVCDSMASDRRTYLLRPDLGRALDADALMRLRESHDPHDLCIVVADGLAAGAVQHHAVPVIAALLDKLARKAWSCGPVVVLRNGRVAAGDVIAESLGAGCVLVLIGERPGLSSPDSMSAYITWQPNKGRTDADRNCVSNIRPAGLPPVQAAGKIAYLLGRMRSEGASGVALKDDMPGLLE